MHAEGEVFVPACEVGSGGPAADAGGRDGFRGFNLVDDFVSHGERIGTVLLVRR